jgi:hypothetical protein
VPKPASERAATTIRIRLMTFMSTPLDLLLSQTSTEGQRRWDF